MWASVRSSNPTNTVREASAMAARISATSSSMRSSGAQIRMASWTGAQTSMPRSVAKQARDPHHLRAVGLHREISQRARVWIFADMHMPTEHRV